MSPTNLNTKMNSPYSINDTLSVVALLTITYFVYTYLPRYLFHIFLCQILKSIFTLHEYFFSLWELPFFKKKKRRKEKHECHGLMVD